MAAAVLVVLVVESAGHAALEGDGVFGAAILGYGVAALIGTVIAAKVADSRTAAAVPLILAGLAIINLFTFPHPPWFFPAAAVALALGWWSGATAARRLRARRAA